MKIFSSLAFTVFIPFLAAANCNGGDQSSKSIPSAKLESESPLDKDEVNKSTFAAPESYESGESEESEVSPDSNGDRPF